MMRIIIFLLLINLNSLGQTKKSIYIYEQDSKSPVQFATILFFESENKQNGVYSDENGLAQIKLGQNSFMEISCIGYENKRVLYNNELKDTIYLKPNVVVLNEVIVSNRKAVRYFGFENQKTSNSLNTFKGNEILVYIKNTYSTEAKIKSVLLHIEKRKDFKVALKIKFYKKNIDDKPADLLNTQEIIYYITKRKKGVLEIDINNFNIDFPKEGAFVGVECLGFVDKSGNFIYNNNLWNDFRFLLVDNEENLTFVRNNLKSNIWYNNLKFRSEEVGERFENYPNVAFGINVYTDEK
jgi:hypothetical protein